MAHPEPAWLHERDGRDHSTGSTVGYQVVQYRPRRTAVVHSGVKPSDLPAFFNRALSSVLAAMEAQATLPAGEPFSPYHVMQPDGVVSLETGFPILGRFQAAVEVVPGELPAGKTVMGVRLGPYESLGNTYADLSAWAIAHGMLL
jgi:hypothetical protein